MFLQKKYLHSVTKKGQKLQKTKKSCHPESVDPLNASNQAQVQNATEGTHGELAKIRRFSMTRLVCFICFRMTKIFNHSTIQLFNYSQLTIHKTPQMDCHKIKDFLSMTVNSRLAISV